jgi:hypothetical protein
MTPFILQVIEYIRFLQEKEQKYEASFPEWNQENAKLLPWVIVFPNLQHEITIAPKLTLALGWLYLNSVLYFAVKHVFSIILEKCTGKFCFLVIECYLGIRF